MAWSIVFLLASWVVGAVVGSTFPTNLLEVWDTINGIRQADHPFKYFDFVFSGLFIGAAIATLIAGWCIFKDLEYRQKATAIAS